METATRSPRVSGTVGVEERAKGRVWVASYRDATGRKCRKTLGPAWVRPAGGTTARGARIWRSANGSKPSAEHLTPREADDALRDLLDTARRAPAPTPPTNRTKTLGDALEVWIAESRDVRGVSPSTLRGYQSIASELARTLGADVRIRALSATAVKAAQLEMLELGRSRASVHHRFASLRRVLELAVDRGWISSNPMDRVDVVPLPKVEPDFNVLEPSEVERVASILARIPPDEMPRLRNGRIWESVAEKTARVRQLWSEIVRFAAYTGLRIGELRALWWSDIDWRGQAIRVARNAPSSGPRDAGARPPKSGKARSVPLIPLAIEALERVRAAALATGPLDLVFPSLDGGMFDAGRVRTAFYDALDAADLGYLREKSNPMTFHDLRHTFGTIAARAFPLADVQAYLGHSDISTTMRYAHHVPRNDAARVLAAAFDADRNA